MKGDQLLHPSSLILLPPLCSALLEDGWTAIYNAALAGSTDIVKILIDHGAKVDLRDTVYAWLTLLKVCIYYFLVLGRIIIFKM